MSHYYGSIPVSARKSEATAQGHKSTGLTVKAASYAGAVEVQFYYNEEAGRDEFEVRQVSHFGNGVSRVLHQGVVGSEAQRDPADFYDVAEEAEIAKGEVDFDPAWEWDEEAQYCTDNNI